MATLVLSTVGTLLGGPAGGAIGSLLGQSIDQQILGPGPRQGPRLGDLAVQTSSYGTAIPKIFGTMRIAGSIIWSTDLKEYSQIAGAKGQPDSITYSYSASFAVALSSRPITSIGRIWADGKLIRTAAGEFTISTGFRVHNGSDDQPVDPLIGSIEGLASAPAYRGLAIAVFENLDLAEFGNRIPFLTFEVQADPAPVSAAQILADVSGGAIASSATATLAGYAAHGRSRAAAVEPIVELCGLDLFDDGKVLSTPAADPQQIDEADLGCSTETGGAARLERSQLSAATMPAQLSLGYYDPSRDFQAGVAKATVDERDDAIEKLDLPAVLDAGVAKAVAETLLARRWAERDRLTLHLPPSYVALRPGARLQPPGSITTWKAQRVTVDSFAVHVELRPVYSTFPSLVADPGRIVAGSAMIAQQTSLVVAELADDGTGSAQSPVIVAAAASAGERWRPVPLQVDVGDASLVTRTAATPAIIGTALNALPPGQSAVFDRSAFVEVELQRPGAWLESREDRALGAAENLALIGDELVQFADVVPLGQSRFRLSKLLRGRRGTEWATATHQTGDRFVLIDERALQRLPVTAAQVGAVVRARAMGLADANGTPSEVQVSGEAMRPPSPVHLRAWFDGAGDLRCTWVRRSRLGWAWLDGVDAPLGCSAELYRATLTGTYGQLESSVNSPQSVFAAGDVASIGNSSLRLDVVQVGDLAPSRPATLQIIS